MMKPMTKAAEHATIDRRKFPRRAISQPVKLELDDGTPVDHFGLLLTDVSAGGVRLFAKNVIFPSSFSLVFLDSGIRRECRIVWRARSEVGVEFVGQSASSIQAKGALSP